MFFPTSGSPTNCKNKLMFKLKNSGYKKYTLIIDSYLPFNNSCLADIHRYPFLPLQSSASYRFQCKHKIFFQLRHWNGLIYFFYSESIVQWSFLCVILMSSPYSSYFNVVSTPFLYKANFMYLCKDHSVCSFLPLI